MEHSALSSYLDIDTFTPYSYDAAVSVAYGVHSLLLNSSFTSNNISLASGQDLFPHLLASEFDGTTGEMLVNI